MVRVFILWAGVHPSCQIDSVSDLEIRIYYDLENGLAGILADKFTFIRGRWMYCPGNV